MWPFAQTLMHLQMTMQITVTWTSGYGLDEAVPLVLWGPEDNKSQFTSPASTLTYIRKDLCGELVPQRMRKIICLNWQFKDNMSIMQVARQCWLDEITDCCGDVYVGPPARTVGWRDPGFIHTAYLEKLWPRTRLSCNTL